MAFGGFGGGNQQPMSEINVTPLLTHAVKIDLPQAQNRANVEKAETVSLSLDTEGRIYWNDRIIADADLAALLADAAGKNPQPELHLRADRNTRYQKIAEVMAQVQSAGLQKLGFITDPAKK